MGFGYATIGDLKTKLIKMIKDSSVSRLVFAQQRQSIA